MGMVVPAPAWSPAVVMVAECVCGAFSAAMWEWFSLPPRSPVRGSMMKSIVSPSATEKVEVE